ncbi:MerR family transcriptional regulator [Nakamurella silvestris]|nr:MerR family transcriptional regulator [Nakamurella silvestris]
MTAAGLPSGGALSIGAVLTRLKPDFPDVSISKIRFLESEGLVTPERTPSGYRQFSLGDVERLRYVLAAQRDQYLPLKVIKEALRAMENGEPVAIGGLRQPRGLVSATDIGLVAAEPARTVRRFTRTELLADSGLTNPVLREMEQVGLLQAGPSGSYDQDAAEIARTVAELLSCGLEPRHLRPMRTEAEREAALVGQLVSAGARQRDPDARERAGSTASQLATTLLKLHALLVRAGVKRELGS